MSVSSMGRKLGIGKVDSYWLIHKELFETTMFKGHIRIFEDSFDAWYNGQLRYRKVEGPPPALADKWDMTLQDFASELGLPDTTAYMVVRERGYLENKVIDGTTYLNRAEFENWYAHQFRYKKVMGEPPGQAFPESMSPHEMSELLGIPLRNTGYYLTKKGVFKTFMADGQLRIDTLSFERWYRSQNHYKKVKTTTGGKIYGIYREEEE